MEKIIFFVGESGAGKTFAQEKIIKEWPSQYCRILSTTTRYARGGEKDGIHYEFITEEEFNAAKAKGSFLQTFNYSGLSYGTRKSEYLRKTPTGIFVCTPEGVLDTIKELAKCDIRFTYEIVFFDPSLEKLKEHNIDSERASRSSIRDLMKQNLKQGLYKDYTVRILKDSSITEHVHRYAI